MTPFFAEGTPAMVELEAMVDKVGLRNVMWALQHISLARLTPGVAGPIRRPRKRIGSAPAAFRPYRRPALIERRIAAVLGAVPRVDRTPASAGPHRLARLRARPALGVSVGVQQSHYCDTEQNKTDRARGSSPSPSFCSDLNGIV